MTTAFVLGGGGRWGAVEVGMLRALDEAGVTPGLTVVEGTALRGDTVMSVSQLGPGAGTARTD